MSSTCLYWLPHPPKKKYLYIILIELMFLLFFLMISSTFLATNVCEKSASFWHLRIGFGFFLRQEYHHCQPAGLCSKLFAFSSGDPREPLCSRQNRKLLVQSPTAKGDARGDVFQHVDLHAVVSAHCADQPHCVEGHQLLGFMKFWHAPHSELKVGLRSSGQHADIWVKTLFFGKLNGINLPFGMVYTTLSESCIILGMVFGIGWFSHMEKSKSMQEPYQI